MRVLLVGSGRIPAPPVTGGGAESYTYFLGRALANLGHTVDLVTGVGPDFRSVSGLRAVPLPVLRFSLQDSYPLTGIGLLLGGLLAQARTRQCLEEGSYDVVNFQSPTSAGRALHWARARGIPTVLTAHNPVPWKLHAAGGLSGRIRSLTYAALDARLFRRADGVIALGKDLRAALIDGLGLAPDRTFAVPVGVDPSLYDAPAPVVAEVCRRMNLPDRYVLFVGRLVAQKGVAGLLDALAGTEIPLVLVGDGPLMPTLVRQARARGSEGRMRFLGRLPVAQMRAIYRGAELLALPSLAEGMPFVVLEAAAAGLAVVATRVEGIEEVVQDGVTGRIVPIGDGAALKEAIGTLFADPERARRLGEAARQRVAAKFSWEAVAKTTADAYRAVIDSHGR